MRFSLIFCALLIAISMGNRGSNNKDIQELRRRMRNLNKWITSIQSKVKQDRVSGKAAREANKDKIMTISNKMALLEQNSVSGKAAREANKDKIMTLSDEMAANKDKIMTLSNETASLVDPPYLYVCGYDIDEYSRDTTITYSSTIINQTNIMVPGGLDLYSGAFSAPISGLYSVTMSGYVTDLNSAAGDTEIYFKKGDTLLLPRVRAGSETSDKIYDNFSRELPIYLNQGENVTLYIAENSAEIFRITFCITLNPAINVVPSSLDLPTSQDEDDQDME